jgi:hypothetical protein
MGKHRRDEGPDTEIFNVQGELDKVDTFEEEYKPRKYEEHVGEVTKMREQE